MQVMVVGIAIRVFAAERRALLLILGVGLLGCAGQGVSAREAHLRVLGTARVNGRVLPYARHSGEPLRGGWLLLAEEIQRLRAAAPGGVLLLDGGGAYQGGWAADSGDGARLLRLLKTLRFDAMLPAPCDWLPGEDAACAYRSAMGAPFLAAGLDGAGERSPPAVPWRIMMMEGVRVALIGLPRPALPLYYPPGHFKTLRFSAPLEGLHAALRAVRAAQPDVILLLADMPCEGGHDGLLHDIVRRYPEIDVVISSGEGPPVEGRSLGSTLHVRPAGALVACVDLVYDTVRSEISGISSRLVAATAAEGSYAIPEAFAALAVTAARPLGTRLTEIAPASHPAAGTPVPAHVLVLATGADLVFCSLPAPAAALDFSGRLTVSDVYQRLPRKQHYYEVLLTAAEVLEVAGGLAAPAWHGWTVVMAGGRVANGRLQLEGGVVPHPRRRLRVVVDGYLLGSAGGRWPAWRALASDPLVRMRRLDVDLRAALIAAAGHPEPETGLALPSGELVR